MSFVLMLESAASIRTANGFLFELQEIGFPSGLPGKKAAFASTLVILPFLFIFVWFIAYFYRNFILVNFFSNFNLIRNINEFHNYKLVRTTSTGSLQSMA